MIINLRINNHKSTLPSSILRSQMFKVNDVNIVEIEEIIISGTHLQSSWQIYQESSSRATVYIWLAQACTHSTADTTEYIQQHICELFNRSMISKLYDSYTHLSRQRAHCRERERELCHILKRCHT